MTTSDATLEPPRDDVAHEAALPITAADGAQLAATLYLPDGAPRGRMLIQSAACTPRRYYRRFARWMAQRGWAVMTFDYRGIGDSAHTSPARHTDGLSAWGLLDAPAAWAALKARVDAPRAVIVGHSVGGQIAGLTDAALEPDAWVMVASQSGYWRLWEGADRLKMWALWHVVIPATRATIGYLPGALVGEPMPGAVASEWAGWGRRPEYILSTPLTDARARQQRLAAIPRQVWSFEDDWIAPRAAVDALASWPGDATLLERRHWTPGQHGLSRVGHFGFFREGCEVLWEELEAFIDR